MDDCQMVYYSENGQQQMEMVENNTMGMNYPTSPYLETRSACFVPSPAANGIK
jgi:hypothetical protein